jgi:hypothetical protein
MVGGHGHSCFLMAQVHYEKFKTLYTAHQKLLPPT